MTKKSNFPKDFLWGASTASHQVEGNTKNQWSVWEEAHAERFARDAETRLKHLYQWGKPPAWEIIAVEATKPENYRSGKGVAHYTAYKDDFALLHSLHMNAFRFSVEWSRIEPEEGQWNVDAIEHYREYIAELQKMHIEPVLTVWHWTLPIWFADKGGFAKKRNLHYFDRYVSKLAEEFGKQVRFVTVLNEPNIYTLISYLAGFWPPESKNIATGLQVYRNLAEAHKRAYRIFKEVAGEQIQIGIAASLTQSYVYKPSNPVNRLVVSAKDYLWNWWFLNRIHRQLDFIGVNFYATEYVDWRLRRHDPAARHNDLGWYMEPSALYDLLLQVDKKYHLPILITENGVADAHDQYRQWWLEETIAVMQKALRAGVQLKGYLHWSLLDNFEWAYGWWPKFGLVAVDRTTGKRTVRNSAKWLAKQISHLSRQS